MNSAYPDKYLEGNHELDASSKMNSELFLFG